MESLSEERRTHDDGVAAVVVAAVESEVEDGLCGNRAGEAICEEVGSSLEGEEGWD